MSVSLRGRKTGDDKNLCFAHVAQMVEHVLGKDEVIGSIPIVGSIESRGERSGSIQ